MGTILFASDLDNTLLFSHRHRQPEDRCVERLNGAEQGFFTRETPDLLPQVVQRVHLLPIPTRHRVPSRGDALTLPRAGRFLPEKARALGVPVADWKKLQHGETVQGREGEVTPAEVLGPPRRGLKFVFSGDTAPCPALEAAAQDADLLLCDATYAEPEQEAQAKQYGHSTFGQSAALAARAGAKRLWLVHYSPMITEPEECLHFAQGAFPRAECGFDGKQLTLQFEEELHG